jgi:hypothetical protein
MGFCGIVDINAVDSSALIAPTLTPANRNPYVGLTINSI